MKVENTIQMISRAFVGSNDYLYQIMLHIVHKNGLKEKFWGISFAMACCFLENAFLDKKFWTPALNIVFCHVSDMILLSAIEKTPFEMMHNEEPYSSLVKVFSFDAVFHIGKPVSKKFNQISEKTIFKNFDNSKGCLIWFEDGKEDLKNRKMRNVRFNKNMFSSNTWKH